MPLCKVIRFNIEYSIHIIKEDILQVCNTNTHKNCEDILKVRNSNIHINPFGKNIKPAKDLLSLD